MKKCVVSVLCSKNEDWTHWTHLTQLSRPLYIELIIYHNINSVSFLGLKMSFMSEALEQKFVGFTRALL